MNKKLNTNAKRALKDFKLEIASEFDDFSARNEVFPIGGVTIQHFIKKAETKINNYNK